MCSSDLIVKTDSYPEAEREAVFLIASHAILLSRLSYSISAAIGLVEYCEQLQSMTNDKNNVGALFEWRNIAAM